MQIDYMEKMEMVGINKTRSRRLRKKLRIQEFMELGFEYSASLATKIDSETENRLLDSFLNEVIESRKLALFGGVAAGFISKAGRGSATEEDRASVEAWLQNQNELLDVKVGQLQDAWN